MAAAKFEKHVALINIVRTTNSATYAFTADRNPIFLYDADAYDQVAAIYFEADMNGGDADDVMYAILSDTASTDVTGSEISVTGATVTRVRSGDIKANLTGGTDYRVRWKRVGNGTGTLNAARLIIVQDGAVTKTETVIELGEDNNVTTSYAAPTVHHLFLWEASRFDGTVTVYWEADLHCATAGSSNTCFSRLYDVTATAAVASSEVSYETDTTLTRVRSGAITLVDGHIYRADVKGDTTGEDVAACKLIIQQTGTPTKTDCYVQILNSQSSGSETSYTAQNRMIQWDAANWVGDTEAYYWEASLYNTNGSNTAYSELYNLTDSAQIGEVTITAATLGRVRSSALTMPSDAGNQLDHRRKTSGVSSAVVNRSFLIAQIDWSSAGGASTYTSWGWGVNGW